MKIRKPTVQPTYNMSPFQGTDYNACISRGEFKEYKDGIEYRLNKIDSGLEGIHTIIDSRIDIKEVERKKIAEDKNEKRKAWIIPAIVAFISAISGAVLTLFLSPK